MKTVILSAVAAASLARHGAKGEAALAKVEAYAIDPSAGANTIKALKGSEALRMRVGGFRVLFVEDATSILVLDFGPRGGIYR